MPKTTPKKKTSAKTRPSKLAKQGKPNIAAVAARKKLKLALEEVHKQMSDLENLHYFGL
jgi:hypothetical protein